MKSYPRHLYEKVLDYEIINGLGATDRYLHRWRLLALPNGRRVYLHRFVGSDSTRDMHDHPKRFVSMGLRGGYVEQTPDGFSQYRAPWIRSFPPRHIHRLRVNRTRPTWTIVYVGPTKREWGFWHAGRWIQWERYLSDRARS